MSEVTWQRDPEFSRANRAEHALVGDYELIAFDLPATLAGPAVIGWELFGPPRHQELIAHGEAQTFGEAKGSRDRLRRTLALHGLPVSSARNLWG